MALTELQRTQLAAHINTSLDAEVIAARTIRNDTELARLYNADSTVVVWRKAIPSDEMGTTVIYNALAAMTTANTSRVQLFMDLNKSSFDGSADIDAYFDDTFSGALNGDGATCRANLAAMLRRFATVAESIWAVGTGTTLAPSDLDFSGSITTTDIGRALNDNP